MDITMWTGKIYRFKGDGVEDKYRATEAELYKYNRRKAKVELLQEQIKDFKGEHPLGAVQFGEKIGSNSGVSDPTAEYVAKQLKKVQEKEEELKRENKFINMVDKGFSVLTILERDILKKKYILGYSWEDIAKETSYSQSQVKRKRREAIGKMSEVMW